MWRSSHRQLPAALGKITKRRTLAPVLALDARRRARWRSCIPMEGGRVAQHSRTCRSRATHFTGNGAADGRCAQLILWRVACARDGRAPAGRHVLAAMDTDHPARDAGGRPWNATSIRSKGCGALASNASSATGTKAASSAAPSDAKVLPSVGDLHSVLGQRAGLVGAWNPGRTQRLDRCGAARRASTRSRDMRIAPIARKIASTTANSSGSIVMPSAILASQASSQPPRSRPNYSTTGTLTAMAFTGNNAISWRVSR